MEEAEKRSSDQCSLSRPSEVSPRILYYRASLSIRVAVVVSVVPFPPVPIFSRAPCGGRHEFRFPLAPRTPLLHPSLPVSQCRLPPPPLPPSRARFIRCLLSAATSSPRARSAAAAALFGVPAAFARPTLRSRGARGRKGGSREAAAGRREEYRCRCMHIDGSNDDVRAASTANT